MVHLNDHNFETTTILSQIIFSRLVKLFFIYTYCLDFLRINDLVVTKFNKNRFGLIQPIGIGSFRLGERSSYRSSRRLGRLSRLPIRRFGWRSIVVVLCSARFLRVNLAATKYATKINGVLTTYMESCI